MRLDKSAYTEEALRLAAMSLEGRAEVLAEEDRRGWDVDLEPAKGADAKAVEADFFNELLAAEYRLLLGAHAKEIAGRLVTQAILSARGGENPPAQPPDSPEFLAEAEAWQREAERG